MVIHVSLAFASLPHSQVDDFSVKILSDLYGNADFPAPTVTKPTLQVAYDDFVAKLAKAQTRGQADTAAKNTARQTLIGLLRDDANYVEGICKGGNLDKLLSTGFEAANTERRKEALLKPASLTLRNGGTGEIIGKVPPVKNTKMYEGRASADGGTTWLPSVYTGDSQHIIWNGLTPGVEYTFQVRALGGATGFSDWTDAVKHRSL